MISIFNSNPARRQLSLSDSTIADLFCRSAAGFAGLPLYHRGESKELRQTELPGILIQKLIPSLSSITEKRKGMIAETETLREQISILFWKQLHKEHIQTCYLAHQDEFTLLVEKKIPPIEIIMKAALVGTPARIYQGLFEKKDRFGKPLVENEIHAPYIRFDYRNPLHNEKGDFLRDECMPAALADRFIDTAKAEALALKVFDILQQTLSKADLLLLDGCLFMDEAGEVVCSELSPDNMRIKSKNWNKRQDFSGDFDKDLWRKRADRDLLIGQWQKLKNKLEEICR